MPRHLTRYGLPVLEKERKDWRMNHPYGYHAKPTKQLNGTLNYFEWDCGIPGNSPSFWIGEEYKLKLFFPENYPSSPPKVKCDKLSVTGEEWVRVPLLEQNYNSRRMNIRIILKAIQELVTSTNDEVEILPINFPKTDSGTMTNHTDTVITHLCIVCRNEFGTGKVLASKCGHLYCESCLRSCFNHNKLCGLCRKDIVMSQVTTLYY